MWNASSLALTRPTGHQRQSRKVIPLCLLRSGEPLVLEGQVVWRYHVTLQKLLRCWASWHASKNEFLGFPGTSWFCSIEWCCCTRLVWRSLPDQKFHTRPSQSVDRISSLLHRICSGKVRLLVWSSLWPWAALIYFLMCSLSSSPSFLVNMSWFWGATPCCVRFGTLNHVCPENTSCWERGIRSIPLANRNTYRATLFCVEEVSHNKIDAVFVWL